MCILPHGEIRAIALKYNNISHLCRECFNYNLKKCRAVYPERTIWPVFEDFKIVVDFE